MRKGEAEERFAIYGGVVDVRPDKVVVLADLAESSFALDLDRAQEAREHAREALEAAPADAENREALAALRRANLAVRISQKIRSRGSALRILEDEGDDA